MMIIVPIDKKLMNLFISDGTLSKLGDVATSPAFKPWELADNTAELKLDLAALTPQVTTY